ncbi:ABC transporter permease [Pseudomonas typographi]|uniref:ABC transporter permease n=1 Tax=Pseudomonas typographi TaxID=2715964 RepID=A0ABR7YWT2_9PSED|nr:ABC transporter permease [Pseudomonas typographi]MBD1552612.1 ABC transporter permease [Pseudomonas typographi]MBD1586193.1 ABC transporter permease [Pseudomonas typographi]MBD1597664.1 ABC transporter permease [Pseudomonas typographi]
MNIEQPPAPLAAALRQGQRWYPLPARWLPGLALAVLAVLAWAALFPATLAPYSPTDMDTNYILQSPSWRHLFGTDENGRDVFSRAVHGAHDSLAIGVLATLIGLGLGMLCGFIGGLGGRALDWAVTRFVEVMFAFPSIVLALLFITVFGNGAYTTAVAVGLSMFPGFARVIRTQVRVQKNAEYINASVALGRSPRFILVRHLVPNVMWPLLALFTLGIGQSIIWGAALGYLGMGAAPPASEWGLLLASGKNFIYSAWWLTLFPGLLIAATSVAATALGRALESRNRNP